MRKLLLLVMAAGLVFTVNAQSKYGQSNEQVLRVADGQEVAIQQNLPTPVLNANPTKGDISRIAIGTATSMKGLRREETRIVSYNPELDVITMTAVLEPGVYAGVDDDGVIGQFYSTDKGATWQGPVILANDISEGPNYYYSGALYNPDGNTDVSAAYGVAQSVIYPPTGDWRFKSFGQSSLAGENQANEIIEETDAAYGYNGYWNIFGLEQVNDEMRSLNMVPAGAWSEFTEIGLEPQVATFNGTNLDWEFQDVVDMELLIADDGFATWRGRWQGQDAATESAWSADGMTGYMWVNGISDNDYSGYQPVLHVTTDGGDSWDYTYLDFQTDEAQALIDPFTPENWAGYMTPYFNETCGVVNANGDLEMFACITAHSSDIFTNPDSIGWSWTYPGDVVNFTINTDGVLEDAIWIDSLLTSNVMADTEGNYCGTTGWQHRIQASRNHDGSQVFCTWADTRDPDAETNTNPDLFGWTKAVDGENTNYIDRLSFTEGTLYETFYFFTNSALLAYAETTEGSTIYTIPTVQGVTPNEFGSNTSDAVDPITINYITGIEFPELLVGINDNLVAHNNISVTQNVPNPFNGSTRITVTTETTANVMVEISNIMGQTIYTSQEGRVNGSKEITLNANNMEAGVYFYTVTVGHESITKKMIVK
ncbi:MAG: T9SS type A sorting domain-containing protein [Chlamydiia bacterium]|nr:T9SS type A sorting domain-containing protein [Chlamydiia bacterium]